VGVDHCGLAILFITDFLLIATWDVSIYTEKGWEADTRNGQQDLPGGFQHRHKRFGLPR
jgi:hypothetical protein